MDDFRLKSENSSTYQSTSRCRPTRANVRDRVIRVVLTTSLWFPYLLRQRTFPPKFPTIASAVLILVSPRCETLKPVSREALLT